MTKQHQKYSVFVKWFRVAEVIKCNISGVGGLVVRLLDLQSGGCGFEPRQGPDVVFLGKGTLHQFSSLHPGGNGYPAIDSGRSCQYVSI